MTKPLRFVTLFPEINDIHFAKDVGQIPYTMQTDFGYCGSITLYKNQRYHRFQENVPGLHQIFFPFFRRYTKLNGILFLLKYARKIDILQLYHLRKKATLLNIFLYLRLNSHGLIYLHLDASSFPNPTDVFNLKHHPLKRFVVSKIIFTKRNRDRTLFGIQSPLQLKILQKSFPFDNILYVPNGLSEKDLCNSAHIPKKDILLFVGRVDDFNQKRTDMLVNAFCKIHSQIPNFKLRLVGPISNTTHSWIMSIAQDASIEDKIEIVGEISDRRKLQLEYARAKIFCFPSAFESFGLVLAEAINNGCLIVGSDIPSTILLTANGKYGDLFIAGNEADLCTKLLQACRDEKKQHFVQTHGHDYIAQNFSYKHSLAAVNQWIRAKHQELNHDE